jgi:hypothetical protein
MNRLGPEKWWHPFEDGFFRVVRAIVLPTYKLVFGRLDKRLALKEELKLGSEIQIALRFLFTEGHGRIIPNKGVRFPPGFDYAYVTVSLEKFSLRFLRGRGELDVRVAPTFAPDDWHDLSLVLAVMDNEIDLHRRTFLDLWDVSKFLEPRMTELNEFLSPDQFNPGKRRLDAEVYTPERNAMREWEAEINWRLYGHRR